MLGLKLNHVSKRGHKDFFYQNELTKIMSVPDSSSGQSIRHESEDLGLESPSGRDIFCL